MPWSCQVLSWLLELLGKQRWEIFVSWQHFLASLGNLTLTFQSVGDRLCQERNAVRLEYSVQVLFFSASSQTTRLCHSQEIFRKVTSLCCTWMEYFLPDIFHISTLNAIILIELHSSVSLERRDGWRPLICPGPPAEAEALEQKRSRAEAERLGTALLSLLLWFALEELSLILIKTIYWPPVISCVLCWAFTIKWNTLRFLTARFFVRASREAVRDVTQWTNRHAGKMTSNCGLR